MRQEEQVAQIRKLMARLDSDTNVDAGGLRQNPSSVYTDPDLAEREWASFFRDHPQIVGFSGDLPEPNAFFTMSDLGTPILATRDGDGVFRAFVNACRHRGATVESEERGTRRVFSCPFHAWSYGTDGQLKSLPKSAHFGGVDTSCLGLVELPAVESHGILWVHVDPEATMDIEALLGEELSAELALWNLGALETLGRDSYDVDCNWKLAMDTFGETYHFQSLHRDTLSPAFYGNVQCYDTYGPHHRMLLCRRDIDTLRGKPEAEWNITTAALPAYWLFPNVQILPMQAGCYLVRAYPVPGEPGRHVSRITFYLRPEIRASLGDEVPTDLLTIAQQFALVIRDEDYVMSASQQRSANSGALSHVLFGRNEPALHHYHSTYREKLGMKPLPLLAEDEVAYAPRHAVGSTE